MAFVPFIDTGKLCIDFSFNGIGASICFWMLKPAATPTDYQALADSAAVNIGMGLMTPQTNDLTANKVTVYDMTSASSPVYTSISGLPVVGSAAVDSTPNNASYVITHRTNSRGRSFRGRNFFPGLTENDVVNGLLGGGVATARLAGWATYINSVELATLWSHVVASQVSGGVDRVLGLTTVVTSYTITDAVRSQRRRTPVP